MSETMNIPPKKKMFLKEVYCCLALTRWYQMRKHQAAHSYIHYSVIELSNKKINNYSM